MILNPRALREGERLSACSDLARLWWPYLAAAGNGYGRMAITYRVIQAYGMTDPPSEEEFYALVQEYRRNWLLFLYIDSSTGDLWGQWYLSGLPAHKTKADESSPAPPEDEYRAWLATYQQAKLRHATARFGNLPSTGQPPECDATATVLRALRTVFVGADEAIAKRIVVEARKVSKGATGEQIVQAMRTVYKRQQDGPGLFVTTVPRAISRVVAAAAHAQAPHPKIEDAGIAPLTEDEERLLAAYDHKRLLNPSYRTDHPRHETD